MVAESGGLPYFLVEYLQAALGGEISTTLDTGKLPLPAGLRGMLQTRLANLSATALQILQAAAVIGRTFESDLLQSISGRTEDEIVQGIEELLARGLIREMPIQTTLNRASTIFDFKYDSVRALVLEEISLIRYACCTAEWLKRCPSMPGSTHPTLWMDRLPIITSRQVY